MIPSPLRVPSTRPGEWVYLRMWSFGFRSNGSLLSAAWATRDGWGVRCEGLEEKHVESSATPEENATALDAYLQSIGAEEVPDDEWPQGCFGEGYRRDRPPYRWWGTT